MYLLFTLRGAQNFTAELNKKLAQLPMLQHYAAAMASRPPGPPPLPLALGTALPLQCLLAVAGSATGSESSLMS
jgi:hypothetical protein